MAEEVKAVATETAEVKTFTQDEVNRIVQERVARVKAETPADYADLKEIEKLLEEFEISGTPAEKREALKSVAEANKEAKKADSYKEAVSAYDGAKDLPSDAFISSLAKEWGKDPSQVKNALKRQIEAAEADDKKAELNKEWDKQLGDFKKKHTEVDVLELLKNDKFQRFIKGKTLSLTEAYEDFIELVSEAEELKKTLKTKEANEKNAASSTGSVKGESPKDDFVSKATFDSNKHNKDWMNKNYDSIIKSMPKWERQ